MNRVSTTAALGAMLAMLALSTHANAAGFRLPNQSAFATARGNAFAATANDASAVYYNPAGLNQLDGSELQVGTQLIKFNSDYDAAGDSFSNKDSWQPVPQAFYASNRGDFAWGLGLYAPFGLGNEWGQSTSFSSITSDAEIRYISFSGVASWQVTDTLALAGGINYDRARADIQQGVGFFPGDTFRFVGSSDDIGYSLATHWKPSEKHAFALVYRSSVTQNLEGDSDVSFAGSSPSSFRIEMPELWVAGYRFRPNSWWDIEANIEWGGWSSLQTSAVEGTPLGDIPYPFEWDDGLIWQLGATRYSEKWAVSFGYDFNEAVQTDFAYNPAVSDADRHWLNIGFSRLQGERPWTLTYQYGFGDRRVSGSLPNAVTGETADGRYDTSAHNLAFSFGFRWL